MRTSEKVDQIIPALLKVKSKLQAVVKSSDNPFYKSKYATLEAHLLEVEPLLAENELLLLQPTSTNPVGQNMVETTIFHKSGQFIGSDLAITMAGLDAQKTGAAITYFRRFGLGSLLAMIAADDDGESAVGRGKGAAKTTGTVINASSVTTATNVPSTTTEAATKAKPSFRDRLKNKKTEAKVEAVAVSSGDDI